MVYELPEACLEVEPVGALVRVVVVEDEAVEEAVADRTVGGLIGSRLGDTFLASFRPWTGRFWTDSLSLTAGFRIERVRLTPVVEDMVHCQEFVANVSAIFGLGQPE